MPRALITSATACRLLWRKAELAGLDTLAMDVQETQIAALKDVCRKWHIPPSFNVEFIAYFLDRVGRISKLKNQLQDFVQNNACLLDEQKASGDKYEQLLNLKAEEDEKNKHLKEKVKMLHEVISTICPRKVLPSVEFLCKPHSTVKQSIEGQSFMSMNPTPAQGSKGSVVSYNAKGVSPAGRADVSSVSSSSASAVLGPCGKCHQSNDPHLLAHCDNCKQYYHLGCLNPPLTRMPKKTKLFGWQCSECDKESSGSDVPCLDPEAPRKLRRKSDKTSQEPFVKSDGEAVLSDSPVNSTTIVNLGNNAEVTVVQESNSENKSKAAKKRRKEKHRYSPEPGTAGNLERKRKRKKKSFDHENWQVEESPSLPQPHVPKIKIKTITPVGEGHTGHTYVASAMTSDEDVSRSGPMQNMPSQVQLASASVNTGIHASNLSAQGLAVSRLQRQSGGKKPKTEDILTHCDQCHGAGSKENLVRCDECLKCFHFHCLDPPVKKSPKIRGYSWHCADCDPSDSSSSSKK